MKIAILDDYQDVVKSLDCFKIIDSYDVNIINETITDIDKLSKLLYNRDILVLIRERTIISESLLSKLPNLKLISQTGKKSNHLDLDACSKYNVLVSEGKGSAVAPSELTWALIMSASRLIPQYVSQLRDGKWQDSFGLSLGRSLNGLTLGIWGYGKIGSKIAQYGKAFGMKVLIWGSDTSRQLAIEDGFDAAENKQTFFQQSDILTLHLRLNEHTKHCVSFADLSLMKPDALLVNTSRAELIEADALLKALNNGQPGFAALDVYENEPVDSQNTPLLALNNVICSPHLGYVEKNSYELYFKIAFENVLNFINQKPTNIANEQLLK